MDRVDARLRVEGAGERVARLESSGPAGTAYGVVRAAECRDALGIRCAEVELIPERLSRVSVVQDPRSLVALVSVSTPAPLPKSESWSIKTDSVELIDAPVSVLRK
jgi:hypothetical protein